MAGVLPWAGLAALVVLARGAGPVRTVEAPVAELPSGWQAGGRAARGERLELSFAVRQQGLAELTQKVLSVSSPSSPEYGQHLANEEVQRLTAPEAAHIEAVESFLRGHGLEPRRATPNGDFIVAEASVELAERMLGTEYSRFIHSSGAEVTRALGGYSLPGDVAAAVDFVAPTTHIPGVRRPRTPKEGHALDEEGLGVNSPKNLRKLYSVGSVEGKAAGNKQAVTAFLEQGYSALSLKAFWAMFCRGIDCGRGLPKTVGDRTGGLPGTESMLDIETITGVAGNVSSEFWGFAGRSSDNPNNEPFLKWLQQVGSTSDAEVPKIFSTSYGENEGSWSMAAAQRLNVEFQKAGARGISLLFASGDSGPNCNAQGKFVPQGPASSPWVTAVGGTGPGKTWPEPGAQAETAAGLSSGGFSNYWPMPEWQKDAVAKYLKQDGIPDKAKRGYNASGRAFPDISAQAENFVVVTAIPVPGVAGTSCAAPTASGVFGLLNDLRLQQGKSSLGFLNPLIYEHAAAFNDITQGAGESDCGNWPAKQGWDAVTGVGTPNYEKLASIVSKLPAGRQSQAGAQILV